MPNKCIPQEKYTISQIVPAETSPHAFNINFQASIDMRSVEKITNMAVGEITLSSNPPYKTDTQHIQMQLNSIRIKTGKLSSGMAKMFQENFLGAFQNTKIK